MLETHQQWCDAKRYADATGRLAEDPSPAQGGGSLEHYWHRC